MNIVPSIELIPAKYGVGTLLTQVPMDSSGDFSVTRATAVATRYNSAGLIETIASGIPRLDYYTSDGTPGCPALLVEPSAQNIMAQSETLSVSGDWGRLNLLVSGGAIASPDGLASGTLLIATSGNVQHNINKNATTSITSGTTIAASCFFKSHGTNTFVQFVVGGFTFSPDSPFANFNLSGNGAITTGTYSSAFIQNYGNGWYRCGLTATAAANGTTNLAIVPIIASGTARNTSFTGDGVNGVYAWGTQVETGSVATSYIPTTTGSITRDADVISKTGVSGLIGQTEGTMYAEFEYKTNIAERRLIALSNGTALDRIMLWTLNNILYAQVEAGSIILASPITEGYHKVAFAYQQSGVSGTLFASLDGGGVVSGTSAAFPASLTDINIGKNEATATSTFFWNARIRSAAIYKTRLSNYLLESATSQIESYSALASSLSYSIV
jgi:hypothetical protein